MKTSCCLTAVGFALLTGCATPHVVQPVKVSDASLSCNQLTSEMLEADRFRADAQKEKGMTGTNVAAVIFFWPAMVGTYSNANDAISAADLRKSNLMGIYNQKKCQDAGLSTTAASPSASGGSVEQKLREIKSMLDRKLITQSEYDTQRKKILAGM